MTPTEPLEFDNVNKIGLDEAHDALADLASKFHNDMRRRGIRELSAAEWLEEFRNWLPSEADFSREHEKTMKLLEEFYSASTP